MRPAVVLTSLLSLALSAEIGCCGPQASGGIDPEARRFVAKAREARGTGQLEAALEEVERALGLAPEEPMVWGERAKICFGLHTSIAAASRAGFERIGYLEDARFSLDKALSLGSRDSELFALRAGLQRREGQFEEARGSAQKALELAIDRATRLEALVELGLAASGELARLKEEGQSEERLQKAAAAAAAPLEEATGLDPGRAPAWVALADVYAALGNEVRELETLRRGLAALPASEILHSAYQERLFARERAAEAAGFLAGVLREDPANATARWFRGRARLARAEELRRAQKPAEALEAYEQAAADWAEAARLRPAYTASCNQAIAFARLGKGSLLIEQEKLEQAAEILFEAYKIWPAIFDQRDRFGSSYVSAMGAIGKTLMGGGRGFLTEDPAGAASAAALARPSTFEGRTASLRKAVAFHRLLIAMHPERSDYIGYWYNNIGFALRDLGILIAQERAVPAASGAAPVPPPDAVKAWEEAYKAYCASMDLLPEDPRIVNDCAVMLVYHLHRDFDRAEQLLRRAAELAQAVLDQGAEMDEPVRNFYEEAAGDAWQNLGLLFLWHRADPAGARPHLERSLKYYPYGARTAARTLRTLPEAPASDRTGALSPQTARPAAASEVHWYASMAPGARWQDDPLSQALKLLAEVEQAESPAEAKGICAEAVELLEEQIAKAGPSAQALHLLGRALHRMARAEMEGRKKDGLAIQGYLDEAATHLRKAIELEGGRIEAHLQLLEVELLRGEPGALGRAALALAGRLAEQAKTLDPALRNRAEAMAGHCLYTEYARQKAAEAGTEEKADEKLAEAAAALLGRCLESAVAGKGALQGVSSPQVVATDLALLWQWRGKSAEAVKALARWAGAAGPDTAILSGLLNAGRNGAQVEAAAAFAALLEKHKDDPTLHWFHGAALCEAGDEQRRLGENEAADKLYDRSMAAMRKVIEMQPGFTENSKTYLVRALSGKGYVARTLKKLEEAGAHFLAALREDPAMKDTLDATRRSPAQGILFVTDDWQKAGKPLQAIQLYRKALDLVPGEVDWSNNMALFARDLGTVLERQGRKKEAQELYETSLWGYKNAVKYSPEDPRLLNDLALIMLYHVTREAGQAKPILERAIAIGERQLEEFPADDPGGKQQLDEAVGDAWQNLGYVLMQLEKDLDQAQEAFYKSMRHYPFERRGEVQRHLGMLRVMRSEAEARKQREEEEKRKQEAGRPGAEGGK